MSVELGLDDQALAVVGQRAGLEREDVLARLGVGHLDIGWADDEGLEDLVGVLGAVGVGDVDLVSAADLVEVAEGQPALGVGVAEAVAGDVDVGLIVPREAGACEVDGGVGLQRLLVVPAA